MELLQITVVKKDTIGILALALLTACSVPAVRTESTRFIAPPQINRIDNGAPGRENSFRLSGYLRYTPETPAQLHYEDSVVDTTIQYGTISTTTSHYSSIALESRTSFGAQAMYCVSDAFALGGVFDFAAYSEAGAAPFFRENALTACQFGFFVRLAATSSIFTFGYRPEISAGIFEGHTDIAEFYDSDAFSESQPFNKLHAAFCQSFFAHIAPLHMLGLFGGLQHKIIPLAVADRRTYYGNTFSCYTGVHVTVLNYFSINPYFAMPLPLEHFNSIASPSFGLSAGLVF
jgi:hypothetical protein